MAAQKSTNAGKKDTGSVYSGMCATVAIAIGMAFAMPTVLVVAVGLLPTVVALLVDMHPKKYAAWSVGFFNFAGLMPYLGDLWTKNNTIVGAMGVLTDVVAWFVIYASAGAGWMVFKWMPVVGAIILEIKTQGQIRKLNAERKKLIHEWGQESPRGRLT